MIPRVRILAVLFALLPAAALAQAPGATTSPASRAASTKPAAAPLRVGAAAELITPPAGTPMSGPNAARAVEAVDDDLYAKAIVLERDGVRVAMVACDLITMPRSIADEARRLIAEQPGIPPDHVMISATHTHTGPLLTGRQDSSDSQAAGRTRAYLASLPQRIADAVRKADAKLTAARALAGVGKEPRLSFNRRYFMKDGPVGWNPGKMNPNVEGPAGPVDPDVPVVYFETAEKAAAPIATHVSFAMHPDTRHGQMISADYPGRLADILAKVRGPEMVTLFALGACGDINHVNVNFRGAQINPKETARIGMVLAGEVLKAYGRIQPVGTTGAIRVRSEVMSLPLQEVKPGELEWAREAILKPSQGRVSLEYVRAAKVLDIAGRAGRPLAAEVQIIALGDDIAWVALPGEMFVELGLEVKKRSPFKHTIIVELANGSVGYVPTKRAFTEGNYEPLAARCAPGSGELLVERAISLLNELKTASE